MYNIGSFLSFSFGFYFEQKNAKIKDNNKTNFGGAEMPPPSALKRKILLKNKRLKADVEKTELELYLKGEFQVN